MKIKLKSSQELRNQIAKKGFIQKEFASHIGLSYEYLNRIVNGQLFPSGKVARMIYEGLELEFDDIFFIENVDNSQRKEEEHCE